MVICAFSDIHQDYKFLKHISSFLKKQKNIDLILIGGDYTHMGNRSEEYTRELLEELDSTGIPYFSVTGNADSVETENFLSEKNVLINNKTIYIKEDTISGFAPNPEKALSDDFTIDNAIVISHIPIKKPKENLPNAPKIWISGHWHRFFTSISFNTYFIYLPSADSQKVVIIDTNKLTAKLFEIK